MFLPNLHRHPVFIDYDARAHEKLTCRRRNQHYGIDLNSIPVCEVDLSHIANAGNLPPRFKLEFKGFIFDFFFVNKPGADKLYIIFSGAKDVNDSYPLFKRHSWNFEFDGSVLYISDPTLALYNNLALGWYLGSPTLNLYYIIAEIINSMSSSLGIKKIITYGSSGGGFAALKIAELVSVTAIAINPQIYIKEYPYYNTFESIVGFKNLPDVDIRTSLNLSDSSIYFIIQNDSDIEHCTYHLYRLLKTRGIFPKYGLNGDANLWSWIYHAFGGHNSQEDRNILGFILYLASKLPIDSHDHLLELDNLSIYISEMWALNTWQKNCLTSTSKC